MPSNLPGPTTTDKSIPLLAGVLLTCFFCAFSALFITPLRKERAALVAEIATTSAELKSQSVQLQETLAQLNHTDPQSEQLCQALLRSLPLPAHVACPALLLKILNQRHAPSPKVNLMAHLLFPASSEFTLSCWKMHSSSAILPELIEAVANLENQLPLSQISDLQFKPAPTNGIPFSEIVIQIPAPN